MPDLDKSNELQAFAGLYLAETGIELDVTLEEDGHLANAHTESLFRAYALGQLHPASTGAEASAEPTADSLDVGDNWNEPGWRKLFLEAVTMMLKEPPTQQMVNDYIDHIDESLQQFCIDNARLEWAMGISVIDAAYLFVEGAYENTNIDKRGNLWPVANLTSHGPY